MKRTLIIAGMCLIDGLAYGQTLRSDGRVVNSSYNTIGYYRSDGAVENASHSVIGYIKSDGIIQNSSHSTIGYLRSDGVMENGNHVGIGKADGNKIESVLKMFFFK